MAKTEAAFARLFRSGLLSLTSIVWFWTSVVKAEVHTATNTGVTAPSAGICPAQLGGAIAAITHRPEFQHSRWGILIQTLGPEPQATLYAQDPEQYFIPASNAKLLTTAAALLQLGPQFRIRTSVYQVNRPDGVTLRVIGQGDPSFTNQQLGELARQIRDRGIRHVAHLIGDNHFFQGDAVNPSWEWEDIQAGYGAPVTSLMLNQNLVGLTLFPQTLGQPLRIDWDDPTEARQWQVENHSVTVGATAPEFLQVGRDLSQPILQVRGQLRQGSSPEPVAVALLQPAQSFIQRLQQALEIENIQVDQTIVTADPVAEPGEAVATVESPTLANLLVTTNQDSNNLYAESLLRWLGISQTTASNKSAATAIATDATQSSLETGLAALKTILTEAGVDPTGYVLADGSGLSRRNWISPASLVQTLQIIARSQHSAIYRASLSVAGENGTLENRFQQTWIQGRLQGKTGSLTGVAALSGYLDPPEYSALTFSILVNQFSQPSGEIRQAIDHILELLVRLKAC